MVRFRLFVPALLLAGCSAAPSALNAPASGPNYGDQHTYASVGLGMAMEDFDLPSGASADDSFLADVRVGHRMHPNLAGEVQFEYLDQFDLDVGGVTVAEADGWGVSANLKAYASTGRVQPYALLGFGLLRVDLQDSMGAGFRGDETDAFARLGVGVDSIVTEELTLGLEGSYVMPFNDLDDFQYFAIGVHLGWRF